MIYVLITVIVALLIYILEIFSTKVFKKLPEKYSFVRSISVGLIVGAVLNFGLQNPGLKTALRKEYFGFVALGIFLGLLPHFLSRIRKKKRFG